MKPGAKTLKSHVGHRAIAIAITDDAGRIVERDRLRRAETVHRQLRPHLASDYLASMQRIFDQGGRMLVALREEEVVGLTVYRIFTTTLDGVLLHVDDLVTDDASRSQGVGHLLVDELSEIGRSAGCASIKLDSSVQGSRAHRFFIREGFAIRSFQFQLPLRPRSAK